MTVDSGKVSGEAWRHVLDTFHVTHVVAGANYIFKVKEDSLLSDNVAAFALNFMLGGFFLLVLYSH